MKPQIADLIALQRVDTSIQEEEAHISGVPDGLAGVDARIQAQQDKLDARKQKLEDARKERRALEGELQSINDKLSKYQDQLMQVKTNDAYQAMLKEIDGTKQEIARYEEKILEDMLAVDELSAEIQELEKLFQADRARLEKEKADLDRAGKDAAARLARHKEERQRLAGSLEPAVLAGYEKVARMRGGVGVAQVKEELCLGCRVKVRPQVFQEVRNGELRQCDSCGRFLYYVEEFAAPPSDAGSPPAGEAPA